MIRVVVVDDEVLVRVGVRAVVTAHGDVEVVGEASDGPEAVAVVERLLPDVVLLDVRMPGGDGLTAATRILRTHPGTAVVMLTLFDEDAYVSAALNDGVSGFLLKTADPEELLTGVRAAAEGAAFLSPRVARRVVDRWVRSDDGHAARARERVAALSDRQREVLALVREGLTNAGIARHLGVTESTIKTHMEAIKERLDEGNRVRTALIAYEAGLTADDPEII